jgi:acetyl esterase/lipase
MEFERSTGGDAPVMTAVMGGEANFPAASPISYVGGPEKADGAGSRPDGASGGSRPVAGFHVTLIHGARDETVPISIAESLAARLIEAGVDPEVIVYEKGDHVDFLFAALSDPDAPVLLDIAEAAARD